jgi:transcriptional regulator with XRE-family HTH domain
VLLNLENFDIGENIRKTRKAKRLSRKKVYELTNIHYSHQGAIERGETNPSIDVLLKLAKAFDTTVSELIGEVDAFDIKLTNLLRRYKFTNRDEIFELLSAIERLSSNEIDPLVKFIIATKKIKPRSSLGYSFTLLNFFLQFVKHHMGINHGCRHISVTKHLLGFADIEPLAKQFCCHRMP